MNIESRKRLLIFFIGIILLFLSFVFSRYGELDYLLTAKEMFPSFLFYLSIFVIFYSFFINNIRNWITTGKFNLNKGWLIFYLGIFFIFFAGILEKEEFTLNFIDYDWEGLIFFETRSYYEILDSIFFYIGFLLISFSFIYSIRFVNIFNK